MKLYEINAALQELLDQVDPETGELTCDLEQLEALTLEREDKLEGLALYAKNAKAEAAAIREEEKALAERRKALETRADRAMAFLDAELGGENFHTPRVAVSHRRTESVEIGAEFLDWARTFGDQYLRFTDPEPDKKAIKTALKAGEIIPGAEIVSKYSMSIK